MLSMRLSLINSSRQYHRGQLRLADHRLVRLTPTNVSRGPNPEGETMSIFSNRHLITIPARGRNILMILLLDWMSASVLASFAFGQVGLMPIPTLQGVQVQEETTFDPAKQRYIYAYTVNNPTGNTGKIWHLEVDVTTT